jgi:DNA-binding transcriptional regulator YiaG
MSVAFRNVEVPGGVVEEWPYEALVTVLERGLAPDWQPVLRAIRAHPWGTVARRVEQYLDYTDDADVRALFGAFLARARSDREQAERSTVAARVRAAIAKSGLTQTEFAARIGTSRSRLSTYASGRVTPAATMLLRIERAAQVS